MTRGRAGAAACAALACLAWGRAAPAAGSVVVLLREPGEQAGVERAGTRLAAELRAAGFAVDERPASGADDARRLVEDAEAGGLFATVLLRRSADEATTDIWVTDHVTHKTVVRRVAARGAGDAADRALALRVVELMRASLVEGLVLPPPVPDPAAGRAPRPPADVVAWTQAVMRTPPAAAPAPVDLSVGIAGVFGGPDLGVAVAPALRVSWRPWTTGSLSLLGVGPAFGARAVGREGTATLRQELALLEGAFEPALRGALRPYVAAGGGAYHLDATGYAAAPFTSGHDEAWAALLAAGAGARLRLAGSAWLVLDARELVALPRPVVTFAGHDVAVAMRPGTLAALSLAVELP